MVDISQFVIHRICEIGVAPQLLVCLDRHGETGRNGQVCHHQFAEAGILAADTMLVLRRVVAVVPDDHVAHHATDLCNATERLDRGEGGIPINDWTLLAHCSFSLG